MAKQKVAKEAKAVQPKYYAVAEETEDFIFSLMKTMHTEIQNNTKVIGCSKIQTVAQLKKTDDITKFFDGTLLYILVNEDLLNALGGASSKDLESEEIIKILINRELNKIQYDDEKDKIVFDNNGFFANGIGINDNQTLLNIKRAHDIQKEVAESLKEKAKEMSVDADI